MAEDYEIESVREITDVNTSTDELQNFVEVHAKTKPHGIAFVVRAIDDGSGDTAGVIAQVAARAQQLETIASS